MRRYVLLPLSLLLLTCGAAPRPTTPIPKPVPPAVVAPVTVDDPEITLWPAVRRGTLENGLTYYVLPHAEPKDRVYMWLAVNAGSVQEDDDQLGLAHFVEHMGFNGTENFPKAGIIDFIEKSGMQFGADLNAYTSFDETVYQLEVPTDDPTLVTTGFGVLHDWARGMLIEPAEVDKERGVVLEEWRLGLGADERVFDKESKVLLAGTRYVDRMTIGKPEILTSAPAAALRRYYEDWYRPDLMAVIVVGDIDPDAMQREIETKFADLEMPGAARQRPSGGMAVQRGTAISVVTDAELADTSVSLVQLMPHQRESTVSDYRRMLLASLTHAMLSERFNDLAAVPASPIRSAGSSTSGYTREIDALMVSAHAKEGQLADATKLLMRELRRAGVAGFGAEEFTRAKTNMLRNIEQSALTIDRADGVELADELTRNFLEREFVSGRQVEFELAQKLIPTITLEEAGALVTSWSERPDRAITITGPATMTKPTDDQVKAWLAEAAVSPVTPWVDPMQGRELLTTLPTPGTITATKTIPELSVTEWTLSNGARVVVRPTDFETDTILFSAISPGGTSVIADADLPSGLVADNVVLSMGFGEFSPRDLGKLLVGKVVTAGPYISEQSEGVSGSSSVRDFEALLQLNYLAFTAPRQDDDAFAIWKAGAIDDTKGRKLNPQQVFADDLAAYANGNNIRRRALTTEELANVDLDTVLAQYRARFANAADFTFVFVGNIDLKTLEPLVLRYIASLPATKAAHERPRDLGIRPLKGVRTREVVRGQEPQASVEFSFTGNDKYSRAGAIDAGILSDIVDVRLREVLREDLGGVYGAWSWGYLGRAPTQQRMFQIGFGCDPQNVAKLKGSVLQIIKELQAKGIDDSYLQKVREIRTRTHQESLRSNAFWSAELSYDYLYGDDPKVLLNLDTVLSRATSSQVKASAKRFFDLKNYTFATLIPVSSP